jgi:hypothetical protein
MVNEMKQTATWLIVYSVHLTGFILEGVGGGDEYIN